SSLDTHVPQDNQAARPSCRMGPNHRTKQDLAGWLPFWLQALAPLSSAAPQRPGRFEPLAAPTANRPRRRDGRYPRLRPPCPGARHKRLPDRSASILIAGHHVGRVSKNVRWAELRDERLDNRRQFHAARVIAKIPVALLLSKRRSVLPVSRSISRVMTSQKEPGTVRSIHAPPLRKRRTTRQTERCGMDAGACQRSLSPVR